MPSTQLGRRAVQLGAVSVVLFGLFTVLVASGQRGGEGFFDNLALATSMLAATGLAIAGGAVGLTAIVRRRERSPLVLGTSLFGLVVLLFAVGEVVFPH